MSSTKDENSNSNVDDKNKRKTANTAKQKEMFLVTKITKHNKVEKN
jgi:hypothetical protein